MLGYIARRILLAIPIAFGVSVVCFSLVYLAPGDPLQTILPVRRHGQDMVEQIKHAYGFDRPLPVQYLLWLGHVLTGDFGMSIATRRPVILEVTGALVQHLHAHQLRGAAGVHHRLHDGRDRRLLPRPRGGSHRHRRRGRRRQPAELLARHRAGHHLRRRTDGAARDRHGSEGLGASSASSAGPMRNT